MQWCRAERAPRALKVRKNAALVNILMCEFGCVCVYDRFTSLLQRPAQGGAGVYRGGGGVAAAGGPEGLRSPTCGKVLQAVAPHCASGGVGLRVKTCTSLGRGEFVGRCHAARGEGVARGSCSGMWRQDYPRAVFPGGRAGSKRRERFTRLVRGGWPPLTRRTARRMCPSCMRGKCRCVCAKRDPQRASVRMRCSVLKDYEPSPGLGGCEGRRPAGRRT